MFKIRIVFTKNDEAAYISHLDLMKSLQRSFCRAKLPVKYSEGFNPHICMSILSPLSTGYRSQYELCDLELTCDEMPVNVKESLNEVLPTGIRVVEAYPSSDGKKVSEIKFSKFEIFMDGGNAEQLSQVFNEPVYFEKKSKRGSKEVNALDYIKEISFVDCTEGVMCTCVLSAGDDPLNPSYIVSILRDKGFLDSNGTVRYTRTAILDEKCDIFS
jgi:radical SAM-linked protein